MPHLAGRAIGRRVIVGQWSFVSANSPQTVGVGSRQSLSWVYCGSDQPTEETQKKKQKHRKKDKV